MSTSWVMAVAALAMGASAGSFVATAAIRSSRAEQALKGRSHCDGCGVALGFAQTVPVLSFIGLGGACSSCGARIDPLHPAAEVVGAMVALAAVLIVPPLQAALIACLGLVLLASSLIDLKTRRLPDGLTLTAAALCAALALLDGVARLEIGLAAAGLAFLVMEGLRRGFAATRRKSGLGFGDVKLVAAFAIWLGAATPWMIVAASMGGLIVFAIVRPKDGRIPFGPLLAASAFIIGISSEAGLWPSLI